MASLLSSYFTTNPLPRVVADTAHEVGYTSITEEDINLLQSSSPNKKAYAGMLEAIRIAHNDNEQTSDREIDPYPVSAETTYEMDRLLDEAEKEVKDPNDALYQKIIKELRGIVGWSAHKHFHFSWPVIIGALVTIIFTIWFYYYNSGRYLTARGEYRCAKAWSDDPNAPDIDIVKISDGEVSSTWDQYRSPAAYKDYWLPVYQERYNEAKESYDKYTAELEAATKRKDRERYKDLIHIVENNMKKYGPLVSELSSADAKTVRKIAMKETKARMRKASPMYYFVLLLLLYSIAIFPLYIISSYGYGYTISRYRFYDKILNEARGLFTEFATSMVGEAQALKFFPNKKVLYVYYEGNNEVKREVKEEMDSRNWGPVASAVMFYTLALLAVTFASVFVMAYSTFTGFKRNYHFTK